MKKNTPKSVHIYLQQHGLSSDPPGSKTHTPTKRKSALEEAGEKPDKKKKTPVKKNTAKTKGKAGAPKKKGPVEKPMHEGSMDTYLTIGLYDARYFLELASKAANIAVTRKRTDLEVRRVLGDTVDCKLWEKVIETEKEKHANLTESEINCR